MLNINEINEEIKKLESCDCTTYAVCQKLAILYIVRDHYKPAATSGSQVKVNDPIATPAPKTL